MSDNPRIRVIDLDDRFGALNTETGVTPVTANSRAAKLRDNLTTAAGFAVIFVGIGAMIHHGMTEYRISARDAILNSVQFSKADHQALRLASESDSSASKMRLWQATHQAIQTGMATRLARMTPPPGALNEVVGYPVSFMSPALRKEFLELPESGKKIAFQFMLDHAGNTIGQAELLASRKVTGLGRHADPGSLGPGDVSRLATAIARKSEMDALNMLAAAALDKAMAAGSRPGRIRRAAPR